MARKWRPQTFDEVVGQEHVRQTLTNAISLDRVHHAFLFTGARGVGKTSIARILAKSLNCESGPTIAPCGHCTACKEIAAGTAMDVFEIDGASNRGINEIRELRESVRYRPSRDRYKVYIIDEVHMLTTEAFNALLKTLEEPPEHVVFIFATTEPERVPVTIQSRCQRFDFKRVPLDQVCGHLRTILASESITIDDDALFMIARESEGSVRDALSLLDQVIAFAGTSISAEQVTGILGISDRRALFEILEALVQGDVSRTLELCKGLFDYGIGTKELANQLLDATRDLLVVKSCENSRTLVDLTKSEWARFHGLAQTVEGGRLERMFGLLLDGCSEIARSPFAKMLLELALIRACQVPPVQSVHEILEQLSTLEARLAGGDAGGGSGGDGPGGGGRARGTATTDGPASRNQTQLLSPATTATQPSNTAGSA
ncbi:MAG: DNA polymerase III subunit gamma/tau [Myxococcales bacterium]|nr:DNA polymerase III subunit gamma/tau [Myxococcales bacterium]